MKRVIVKLDTSVDNGPTYTAGSWMRVPDKVADELVRRGLAREIPDVDPRPAPARPAPRRIPGRWTR